MNSSSKMKASGNSRQPEPTSSKTPLAPSQRIRAYYQLTKPGIIYGNCLTTAAGFLFASNFLAIGLASWLRFAATLVGTACIIATGCILNNYMDRGIDAKMERTKRRALVTGTIPARSALIFAAILALVGLALLISFTNLTTVYTGIIGLYTYVIAYGATKRRSPWGTLVGSVPGATPLVAGYTAVTGRFDLTALLLFLTMVCWQMPHFYAIAIYRRKDYQAAGLPVLTVASSVRHTKQQMVAFIVSYLGCIALLYTHGNAGLAFTVIMVLLTIVWLWRAINGLSRKSIDENNRWARKMFGYSLLILLAFSVLLAGNSVLP